MGSTGGGVWRTDDAGQNWRNLTDGQIDAGSIGSIAVAPSDPNVIYVGTGSACPRGNVSAGVGMYRSTDAGKTWKHIGLPEAGQIGRVRVHPQNPEIRGITIAQLSGPPARPDATVKNAVIVSTGVLDWDKPSSWTGALDRSPCGTGTCAKMAALHAKGKLALNEDFHHEGPLGTVFTGRLVRETKVGEYDAVVPTLSGQAWITGFAQYVVDPEDPFPNGFTVGDIWGAQP